ncbi:MAG: Smr/MutS family protein [Bacteroidales bacterium]|jgi:DNA mismatch repair protein MutS2|nr:Smr/MutS family protein [Bacteroidales bacterium]
MEETLGRLEQKLGFDRVRAAIADRCSTDYAAARVEGEVFSTDPAEIRKRLQLTDEMRLILMFEESFPSSGYIDCLHFLEPIGKNASIDQLSLGRLRTMLDTLRKVTGFFRGIKDGIYPGLKRMAAGVTGFPDVQRRIDGILDKYGEIKDTASDKLYEIRTSIREREINVSKRMNAILRKAQQDGLVEADASVSIRDGKMLIPVASAKKRQFQGFVYDESATGKTTFIEPAEIVALTNEISELRFAETREIARILHEFSEFLRPYVPDLMDAAVFLGEIDFLMAKANVALDYIAGMPVLSESGELSLRKARHPLLERALRKERRPIVPLTVTLTPTKHILLISGPNAGGKSVCLKTVGLLQYMFQWGMLIPTSETSELPVFDRILVSIGDDQSIDNDLSTYSSFLSDMKTMLSVADGRTLVLIDEFGSGTEPAAGGSIAEAILAELDRRGTYGVITTHYTNLKLYASGAETGVINGAMQFDAKNIAPLFQLEIGLPGNSFAFELARKMGLPEPIVKDAEDRAGEEFVGIERNLRRIARNRRALDEKLTKIRATDKTLEAVTDRYQKELQDIKQLRKNILEEARKEAEEIVRRANREVENTIRTIKETQAEKEATKDAREQLQGFLGALAEKKMDDKRNREEYLDRKLKSLQDRKERDKARKARRASPEDRERMAAGEDEAEKMAAFRSAPLKVGEKVRIKDSGMVGEVSKVSTKAVTVIVGNLSTKLPLDRVERVTSNEYRAAVRETPKPRQVYDAGIAERKARFQLELDVRGQRVGEAIENVMRYIDDAIMLDVNSVRILHGKGTGALREEIQKYARTVPGVVSAADEHIQFGGSGVTVIKFG